MFYNFSRFISRLYWFPLKVIYTTSVTCINSYYSGGAFYLPFNIMLILLLCLNIYWFFVSRFCNYRKNLSRLLIFRKILLKDFLKEVLHFSLKFDVSKWQFLFTKVGKLHIFEETFKKASVKIQWLREHDKSSLIDKKQNIFFFKFLLFNLTYWVVQIRKSICKNMKFFWKIFKEIDELTLWCVVLFLKYFLVLFEIEFFYYI